MSSFTHPCPSVGPHLVVDLSTPKVLHLQLNRPKQLNAMTDALEKDLCSVLDWYETESSLWILIISGSGRAFCAGQDLIDWSKRPTLPAERTTTPDGASHLLQNAKETEGFVQKIRAGGFAGLSSRRSNKPVIAAVHGIAMGGGVEILLNCDLVVATSTSVFALPEVSRGVVAAQGGIPRLAAVAGHHLASRLLLTGEKITADQACSTYRFVTHLVPISITASDQSAQSQVLTRALELAVQIAHNSPDAVSVTKSALLDARHAASCLGSAGTRISGEGDSDPYAKEDGIDALPIKAYKSLRTRALYAGRNLKEGLSAFAQKRPVRWTDPPRIPDDTTTAARHRLSKL